MSKKKFSQLPAATDTGLNDLLAVAQVDSNAETGFTSKKLLVSLLAAKIASDTEYATDLPDFTDKTITGALQELKVMLISQIPVKTTSPAPIANFTTDLALPLKSLKVEIKPKQASGTPTPSSPLPISGTDTITVYGYGGNLWDEQWELGAYADTTGLPTASDNRIRSKNFIPVKPNTTYYFREPQSIRVFNYGLTQDSDYLGYTDVPVSGENAHLYTAPSGCHFIRFRMGSSANPVTTYNNNISINYPITDTEYHAHVTPTTKTVSLPETVYGGEVDVIGGSGTITHDIITFDGTETWAFNSTNNYFYTTFAGLSINNQSNLIASNSIICRLVTPNILRVYIASNPDYIDSSTDMNTIMTNGTQLVYELATPTPITLANPIDLTAKAGVNNVFGDTNGNTSVEYRESVQKYIDEQIASVQALVL